MKKLLLLPVLTFAAWSAYWVMRGNQGQLYDFILSGEEMRVELGNSVSGKLKSVQATMRGLKAVAMPDALAPPVTQIEAGTLSLVPSAAPLQNGMSARFCHELGQGEFSRRG